MPHIDVLVIEGADGGFVRNGAVSANGIKALGRPRIELQAQ
jgi:hypothetical protein